MKFAFFRETQTAKSGNEIDSLAVSSCVYNNLKIYWSCFSSGFSRENFFRQQPFGRKPTPKHIATDPSVIKKKKNAETKVFDTHVNTRNICVFARQNANCNTLRALVVKHWRLEIPGDFWQILYKTNRFTVQVK